MYKLGKKPARPGAVSLLFSAVFNEDKLPDPPMAFGHYDIGAPWGDLANRRVGDCVFAGGDHETMLWTRLGGKMAVFDDKATLSDYSLLTGFDPKRPEQTDRGTDMQTAASFRRQTGLIDADGVRHKVDSYVALRPGDTNQLAKAVYILGAAGVGIEFPASAMTQFQMGEPWDVIPNAHIMGGHYIPCVGRKENGNFLIVSWGELHEMTPMFFSTYCDEALAYLSIEELKNKVSPEGLNLWYLKDALAQLGGSRHMAENKGAIEGVHIDPSLIDAIFLRIKAMVDKDVPAFERYMITDDMLKKVATEAAIAATEFGNSKEVL